MAGATIPQVSFASGRISARLAARVDIDRYHVAARELENFIVMREGGVTNRPGTTMVAACERGAVRLIKFQFNADQTYVLEFGDEYMRVYRDGHPVLYPEGHESAGQPVEIETPYAESDLDGLDLLQLRAAQAADIITIVHPDYEPRKLARTDHHLWTLTTLDFNPVVAAPTGLSVRYSHPGGTFTVQYKITAVDDSGNESSPTDEVTASGVYFSTDYTDRIALVWDTVEGGATKWNVYRADDGSGIFCWVGQASPIAQFTDTYISPSHAYTVPVDRNPFNAAGKYPSCIAYYQQRLMFAGSDDKPQTVWASRPGSWTDFRAADIPVADDALEFTIASGRVDRIQWLLPLRVLLIGTNGTEYACGKPGEALTPATIGVDAQSQNGSSGLQPIVCNRTALYVQDMGSIVRSMQYDYTGDSYDGQDVSVMTSDWFEGHTIIDWDYARIPFSVVWCVRDDGVLLAMTYMQEHQVIGWSMHTTDGAFERVCCVSEGTEDAVYVVVKRTIDGTEKRFIERFATRTVGDIADCHFVDCGLTFDGRNTNPAATMTISDGETWLADDTVTVTHAGFRAFRDDDIGQQIVMAGADGESVMVEIVGVAEGHGSVTARCQGPVPTSLQGVATGQFAMAYDSFAGLDHLEGKEVAVLADGFPHEPVTVTDGTITLSAPATRVHAGLPYVSRLQTLGITVAGNELRSRLKNSGRCFALVHETLGIQAGQDWDNLSEPRWRTDENYREQARLVSDLMDIPYASTWNRLGAVCIQQAQPLPATILAVTPEVVFGG